MKLRAPALAALMVLLGPAPALSQSEDAAVLEKPCQRGVSISCANLAVLYKHGRSVPKDHPRALTLFVKACEGGVDFACGNVGEMTWLGQGVAANQANGAALIKGACRRGDVWSCETARRLGVKMPKKAPA